MSVLVKEEFTVSISGEVARAVQNRYGKEDYSIMVENFFKLILPVKREDQGLMLSAQLRGCAASSVLVEKTDKEIRAMMYHEKYEI